MKALLPKFDQYVLLRNCSRLGLAQLHRINFWLNLGLPYVCNHRFRKDRINSLCRPIQVSGVFISSIGVRAAQERSAKKQVFNHSSCT